MTPLKIKFKFPHIYRYFSAYLFWLIIITIILANIFHSTILGFTPLAQIRYYILESPFNYIHHLSLGNYFLSQNNLLWAQKEYQLAQEFYQKNTNQQYKNQVLGISYSPDDFWNEIQNSQNLKEEEIFFWKEILQKNPDYNFAYLKLATLYLDKNKKYQSLFYLKSILNRDPTNNFAQKLLREVKY